MKRGWIGFALLTVLLAVGSLSAWKMVSWHEPLEDLMEQAARQALAADWDTAEAMSNRAEAAWENHWNLAAIFADHGPMEEIDALFAQLEVYAQRREALSYAALCRELARELGAMGDAHTPTWWNLL